MAKSKKDKMKEKLKKRTQEQHQRRDDSGRFRDYFDKGKMTDLKVSKWLPDKNTHIIDIVPYFTGEKDPNVPADEPAYVLDIRVHTRVGVNEDQYVCLAQYNEPCPICEEIAQRKADDLDWEKEIKPLLPKRRAVYNVIVRDDGKQEAKGIQVLEIAHWFMERHLSKIAKDPRGGGYTVFSDPDEGKSIIFERTGTGADNTNYDGHRFLDREKNDIDDFLDDALCLDDLIHKPTYDEVYQAFHVTTPNDEGAGDTDASADPESSSNKKEGKKEKGKKKKNKCPVDGGVYGQDCDEYDECDECSLHSKCEALSEED